MSIGPIWLIVLFKSLSLVIFCLFPLPIIEKEVLIFPNRTVALFLPPLLLDFALF